MSYLDDLRKLRELETQRDKLQKELAALTAINPLLKELGDLRLREYKLEVNVYKLLIEGNLKECLLDLNELHSVADAIEKAHDKIRITLSNLGYTTW